MIWKSLSVVSASSSPIVVVLSGSMEPAFQRGDLLFLWNRAPRAEIGEVVVYNVVGDNSIPCLVYLELTWIFSPPAERKGYPHRASCNKDVPGGWRKEQECEGGHSVRLHSIDGFTKRKVTTWMLTMRSSDAAPDSHMLLTKVYTRSSHLYQLWKLTISF